MNGARPVHNFDECAQGAPGPWYDIDTPFIPLQWQPAALLDLLQMREVDLETVLRGTRIFREDVREKRYVSPRQLGLLLDNSRKALPQAELGFLLGQRMFPGHFDACTALLMNAGNLQQALAVLVQYPMQLSPLCTPVMTMTDATCAIHWRDSFGLCRGPRATLITEAFITGFMAYCSWLSEQPLPWYLELTYAAPRHSAAYDVHVGANIHFDQPETRLIISRDWLYQPWPRSSKTGFMLAQEQAEAAYAGAPNRGFIKCVHQYVRLNLDQPPTLTSTAEFFGMSNATFKRRLSQHGLSFRNILDEERKISALKLLQAGDLPSPEIARKLHFYDVNNFRRAFKRWTGFSPADVRKRG